MKSLKNLMIAGFLILLSTSCIPAFSQSALKGIYSGKAFINGRPADSVQVTVTREKIYGILGLQVFTSKCDLEGRFSVAIDSITGMQKANFAFLGIERIQLPTAYIEAGDKVMINCSGYRDSLSAVFAGKGSGKFKYSYRVRNIGSFPEFLAIKDRPEFKRESGRYELSDLEAIMRLSTYNCHRLLKVLENYRSLLSPQACALIETDIRAGILQTLTVSFREFYFKNPRPEILGYYRLQSTMLEDHHSQLIQSYSDDYIEYLFRKAQTEQCLKSGSLKLTINQMFERIKADFTGVLRERVLTRFLMSRPPGDEQEYFAALKDALKYLEPGKRKNTMIAQLNVFQPMTDAYNFSLPDKNGKMVSLSDFKGKVVLVDVWFTGCTACISLAKVLREQVMPAFKATDQVKLITINVDKSVQRWKDSILSGSYSEPGAIDLFTEGKNFNHPFIRYYNITGCPALLFIDQNGKLISAVVEKNADSINKVITKILSIENKRG